MGDVKDMRHILMHKNIPTLSFDIDNDGMAGNIESVINKSHTPIYILQNKFLNPNNALRDWWKTRAIPASRENLPETLSYLDVKNSQILMLKHYGLNLSDHYWVATDELLEKGIRWEDVNFFQNDFSSDIGNALFGNYPQSKSLSFSFDSPDSSSDGELKKKWIINNGTRHLLKGGRKTFQQEPFNEVLVSKICDELNIPHVPYKLVKKRGNQFYSSCPCMVDENTELISAWELFNTATKTNSMSYFEQFTEGMKNCNFDFDEKAKQNLSIMFTLDYLVANTDRHFKNFGFIRDVNTLEWKGIAPIYDTGNSMFYDDSLYNLKNPKLRTAEKIKAKPFNSNHKKQLALIIKNCGIPNIDFSVLKKKEIGKWFSNLLEQNPQNEFGRSHILGNILNNRVEELQKVIHSLRQTQSISISNDDRMSIGD